METTRYKTTSWLTNGPQYNRVHMLVIVTISLCVVGERGTFNFVHLNNNHYEFQSNFSNPHSDWSHTYKLHPLRRDKKRQQNKKLYMQSMCSRSCSTTATGTRWIWRPDPRTPSTTVTKSTKRRLGRRVKISMYRGGGETGSKTGWSAVFRNRGRR